VHSYSRWQQLPPPVSLFTFVFLRTLTFVFLRALTFVFLRALTFVFLPALALIVALILFLLPRIILVIAVVKFAKRWTTNNDEGAFVAMVSFSERNKTNQESAESLPSTLSTNGCKLIQELAADLIPNAELGANVFSANSSTTDLLSMLTVPLLTFFHC